MGGPSVTAVLILVGLICHAVAQDGAPSGRQPSGPRVLRLPNVDANRQGAAIRRRFQGLGGSPRRLRINEDGGFEQAGPTQISQQTDVLPQSRPQPSQISEPEAVRAVRQGLANRQQQIPRAPPPPTSDLASLLGFNPGLLAGQTSGSLPSFGGGNAPRPQQLGVGREGAAQPSPLPQVPFQQKQPISQASFNLPAQTPFGIPSLLSQGAGGVLSQPPNPLLNPLGAINTPLPAGALAGDLTSPQQSTGFNFPNAGQLGVDSPGLLGVLTGLAKQVTKASGLSKLLNKNPGGGLPNVPGQQWSPAQSFPGLPANAGLPSLPGIDLAQLAGLQGGALGQNGRNVDLIPLISAITNRVTNGSNLASVLPPNRLQGFADNLTESLLPETAGVDLNKFMGRWFEGINSPRASEQRCVVHHYGGLTENGKTATFTALKIYRDGSEYGQVRYSIGYAFRGGHRDGMLQMHTSETADPVPYWIYKVGPEGSDPFGNLQYEYAVISNWVRYPVTILVRDPDTFKKKYEVEVLRWLEDQNFINGFIRAFNLLQPSNYENCQYADSTFEVFG